MLRRHAILLGLFVVSAGALLFEILLTKFFGSKLEHHFTFAVISTAMLGFGAAGVYVHLRPAAFATHEGPDPRVLAHYAWWFGIACMLTIPVFCFAPLDPLTPGWLGALSLPLYFLMFAAPFFLVGVCVSYTLIAARQSPGIVYFWDLLGAGVGAVLAAVTLRPLTGYGAVVVAGLLGVAAAALYWYGASRRSLLDALRWRLPLAAVVALGVLLYPMVGRAVYGHDILTAKYGVLRKTLLVDFDGIELSSWNPIARIDVSKTGDSMERAYRNGIAHRFDTEPMVGRIILVDGGASTRQFALSGPPPQQEFLKHALWAAPYVVLDPRTPPERALVIGAGGGVDILVSKAFATKHIDAIELNPDTYRLVRGLAEDPQRDRYVPWLQTDGTSTVTLTNTEARHYCHTVGRLESYDVIEASGVDTLTAIRSAANALSENFLYTQDALADYYRLLKPGGVLSLSHGYSLPGTLTLRKFVTYLEFLDQQGAEHPGRSIVFVFDNYWENGLLKKGEFTPEEIRRLADWASLNNYHFIYRPFLGPDARPARPLGDAFAHLDDEAYERIAKYYAPFLDPTRESVRVDELPFYPLARAADAAERQRILSTLRWDVTPATDERPYFYFLKPRRADWTSALDGAFLYPQPAVRWMFVAAMVASLLLMLAPIVVRRTSGTPVHANRTRRAALQALPFFALTGFAFMLVENVAFLNLTLFVGGPMYSLAIVLPAVLIGYAVGSLLTARYLVGARRNLALLLGIYVVVAALYALCARYGLPLLIGRSWALRVLVSALVTLPLGAALGVPVPWYMHSLKETDSRSLAWMWAVSSAFNVIGSMTFVPVCYALGRTHTMTLAAVMYLLAIVWAGFARRTLTTAAAAAQA